MDWPKEKAKEKSIQPFLMLISSVTIIPSLRARKTIAYMRKEVSGQKI